MRKSLRRVAMATAVLGAPLIFGVQILALQAARADTQVFKDILRPHGVARSQAQKIGDGRACGATADNTFTNASAFQKCMRARGWAVDHVVPDASDVGDASVSNPYGDNNVWIDATNRRRGDAAAEADADYCGRRLGPDYAGEETSPALKQCMLSRGWRFDHTEGSPTWIDPDNGLECRSAGIAAVCGPPKGTVTYVNKRGYPCRRTGLISVCTNL